MLGLLTLPIELLRLAFYALQGLVDALRAHNRLRSEFTVLINASRDAVWLSLVTQPLACPHEARSRLRHSADFTSSPITAAT